MKNRRTELRDGSPQVEPNLRRRLLVRRLVQVTMASSTAIAFRTPRSTQTERVVGAALGYADAREWTALYETTVGGVEAQLFAKLGDVGGILIVGKREGMTALLITKGAPNLLALLAGLS